ncbi:MAG: 30S ribosomal protein S9 [Candidatus Magasanikbacteria bacterium CG10_big_fil_rev_8_21_14_0_10_47_10]|uniref:Small ribosomal subunit protein uS9 n=1 Tax=Candidatus Magasanikbacteria bacterium CG10_big_fil_rev_8_21_14_0_10_47_10 TaxID=1974652 RepID=A0A2H0TQI5_9BACT|nr:MAG: 30S ribosomal protein S9 [Candidatus Magasanikbacteria bacterium CG10_big_fil_rev_8_21_14_0_10_47_10]
MATSDNNSARAVGRRKTAAARVRIQPGSGTITINGKELTQYFPIVFWSEKVLAPLQKVSREKDMDVSVKVLGGGPNAQAEAVRHGIARALVAWDEALKPILKAEGFLTRDSRARERKKFGLHRARRAHQWRKR